MNKEWFVFKGTHHLGPFSKEEIVSLFHTSEINAQTLIWKEGNEEWEQISKTEAFASLFRPSIPKELPKVVAVVESIVDQPKIQPQIQKAREFPLPPPEEPIRPVLPTLPDIPDNISDEFPPPIPLEAIIDPKGHVRQKLKIDQMGLRYSRYGLIVGVILFAIVLGRYVLMEKDAAISLKIKGLMPIYLEKLELTATNHSPRFEVAMTLSLDSLVLWGSTNFGGEVVSEIQFNSIPKRVLGTEDVSLIVRGKFINHVGKFNKMILIKGSKFVPGEYQFKATALSTHVINRTFKSLSGISFFKSLNKTYSYKGSALIYPGTPREFEKRLLDFTQDVATEQLKPLQDKLERMQTFETILNGTSQNFLMELEKAKFGKSISSFEAKFLKEFSPLLQSLMMKATEMALDPKYSEEENNVQTIAPFKQQVFIGKQIGELASDMITGTEKYKILTDINKVALRREFNNRANGIKSQIDLTIKNLEVQIQKISR
jgi:hypothetical protein